MAEMASAWHSNKRQRPADPAPPAPTAADDAPWVQRSAAAGVWHHTQQQQQQQPTLAASGRGWGGDLWGSGGDAGSDDQQEAGSTGQHGWSEDSGWDADQDDPQQQEQQQQEWDGGVWGQQDDDADPAQQQQQDDIEAEAEEGDNSEDEQEQQEDADDEPVQLESADFDLSRDEVIARIEQLAFDLIASAAADGQLPTLSCISTARSNVYMAPRHSSLTTAAGRRGSQGFGASRNTQQGYGTQGSAGQLEEQDWEGSDADAAAAAAAGAKDGGGSQQQQQQQHVLRLGSKVQTKSLVAIGGAQAKSIVRALQLLDSVHALLRSGRSTTQRDVYYNLVGRPGFQATCDVSSAISSVLGTLRVPRAALGISAASKGAVAGCLLLRPRPGDAWVDCRSVGPSGRPIPGEVGAVDATALRPAGARFILVVEKDAVFQSLVESRLHEQLPCVIITGRGMPDVASRAFLAAVVEASKAWGAAGAAAGAGAAVGTSAASLSSPWQQQQQQPLPVLGLVDWNPGGVGILLAYKYGAAALGLESARYAVPSLCWLGVTSHMLQEGRVPQSRCHALSDRDKTLLPGLKARLAGCPAWFQELQEMEGLGLKADIEALQHEELLRQVQQRVLQGNYLR